MVLKNDRRLVKALSPQRFQIELDSCGFCTLCGVFQRVWAKEVFSSLSSSYLPEKWWDAMRCTGQRIESTDRVGLLRILHFVRSFPKSLSKWSFLISLLKLPANCDRGLLTLRLNSLLDWPSEQASWTWSKQCRNILSRYSNDIF